MQDYTNYMKWAVVYFHDRSEQDDRRSKLSVEALFSSPMQAKDNYIIRNKEVKRYIVHIDDLKRFEDFYNYVQDGKTEKEFSLEETRKYSFLLGI